MTDAELWDAWRFWMAVAGVIVVVAAALLVAIWVTARQILAEAQRALAAVELIQQRTSAVWALEATNDVAGRIRDTVGAVAGKGTSLVETLERTRAGK